MIFLYILFYQNSSDGYSKKKVLMKKLEQCTNNDDLPVVLSDFVIYQESKGNYLLRGNIVIKKDLPKKWVAKVRQN